MWRDAVQAWLYRPEAGASMRLAARAVARAGPWRAELPRSTSRVPVVMRGWGGHAASGRVPVADARAFGDEAAAMRRALPEVDLWVGRADAILAAARSADMVLVDDGFQDPRLPRTADVVVVDATAPR